MTQPPAQCGRTYVHLPHDTTEGRCAGLDGTEVMRGRTCDEPGCDRDHPAEVRAALEDAHRAGGPRG